MKKILSMLLVALTIMNANNFRAHSLGIDKVEYDEWGAKLIYVSSEKINDYIKELQQETDKCFAKYNDWYKDHTWKGAILSSICLWLPLATMAVFYKPIKYLFYKEGTENNALNTGSTSSSSAEQSREGSPTPQLRQAPAQGPSPWRELGKATLFTSILGLITGISLFAGLVLTNKFAPGTRYLECVSLKHRNDDIIEEIKASKVWGLSKEIKEYGVFIKCPRGDEGICIVNSQSPEDWKNESESERMHELMKDEL